MMSGWVHLPRFVDKVRLHLAGKLAKDYAENFTSGFDGRWLETAGVKAEDFIAVVKQTVCDGEVADWVRKNVRRTDAEKKAFNDFVLNRGNDEEAARARLEQRKKDCGLTHRTDVKTFVDFIDADEGRL